MLTDANADPRGHMAALSFTATRSLQGLQLKPPACDVMATPAGLAAMRQQAVMLHHGAVAGMLGEHPCAAEACRLAKRWAAAQMLSFHLPGEAVELLVASVFTGCVPRRTAWWLRLQSHSILPLNSVVTTAGNHLLCCRKNVAHAPASAQAAFLRFLALLATHPWQLHPLVVDPAGHMSHEQLTAALVDFEAKGMSRGSVGCLLVTPYDPAGTLWTQHSPSPDMLQRAQALAGKALATLSQELLHAEFVSGCVRPPRVARCQPGIRGRSQRSDAIRSRSRHIQLRSTCSEAWQEAFLADLAAFDALVLLREESLPQMAMAFSPSALERWGDALPASASTAVTEALDEEMPQSKRARAVVSHIPRCAAALALPATCVPRVQASEIRYNAGVDGSGLSCLHTTFCHDALKCYACS